MTKAEIIVSLKDQARDKDILANGEKDSIFTRDAQALREAAEMLEKSEVVKHGPWIRCKGKSGLWYCSECGEKIIYKQRRTYNVPKVPVEVKNKFCRCCGAKMSGGADGD